MSPPRVMRTHPYELYQWEAGPETSFFDHITYHLRNKIYCLQCQGTEDLGSRDPSIDRDFCISVGMVTSLHHTDRHLLTNNRCL